MVPELARKVVQGFTGAIKGLRLYPLRHPAVERQILSLYEDLCVFLRGKDRIRLGLLEGTLFIEDHLFTETVPAAEELGQLLKNLEIEGLEFRFGLAEDELRTLLSLLVNGGGKGRVFENTLAKRQLSHISVVKPEEEEEEKRPRQIYGRALKVVDTIFQDVRLGKIPSSAEALNVVKSMAELTLSEPHALFALSMLKDYDNYTFTHSVNVSVIALAVGRSCGLTEEQLRILGFGSLLHDLGKLKIDVGIITKPGRLTEEEFEEIKRHPRTGADIVAGMEGVTPEVIDIVLGHHLRYDQAGYPAEVSGKKLSPMTSMTSIADTYDAITTLRSYQRPMTPRKAIERLRELTGTVLHPQFTESFIASLGTYPVGSLVRLDSNEIGLVVWVDTHDPDSVRLKILFDENGERLAVPARLTLIGKKAHRIVAEVDPFVKGVEVTDYFD
jgi:HD-GYP domain-containing protein (c-di-GMP phosphodiesterase class II)